MDAYIKDSLQAAGLWDYFNNLPPSHQKEYIQWISEAKRPETRQKRIAKMVEMLKTKRQA